MAIRSDLPTKCVDCVDRFCLASTIPSENPKDTIVFSLPAFFQDFAAFFQDIVPSGLDFLQPYVDHPLTTDHFARSQNWKMGFLEGQSLLGTPPYPPRTQLRLMEYFARYYRNTIREIQRCLVDTIASSVQLAEVSNL